MISYRRADLLDMMKQNPAPKDEPAKSGIEHTTGTLYEMPFHGNHKNMKWTANPEGYEDGIRFWVSNPNEIPQQLKHEGKRIPISFHPQDQYCRYEK